MPFAAAPLDHTDERRHRRAIAAVANRNQQGKLNCVGTVELVDLTTTTTVNDPLCSPMSQIQFDPLSLDAATELYAGTMYVAEADRLGGSFTITHSSDTSIRTFRYILIG